ncbi:hypothetical protein [Streptomyces sp. NPDC047525]|uniref:hypothetical protein n=1 Tax=Streptomyces sp. NPDC047525 TaxID=3155264 RepID=UPI0033F07542
MTDDKGRPRPPLWRAQHPEAYAELKRTYGVIGHSSVLMVLSLSLIGTTLTLGYLHLPEWVDRVVRLVASLAAVCCAAIALWRLLRALWRSVLAVVRTCRRRPTDGAASL